MEMPTYEELLGQIKANFWFCGIPFDEPSLKIRFYVLVVTINMLIVEESCFLMSKRDEDLLVLAELAPCCFIGLLSVLKMLPLAVKKDKVFKLTACLHGLYNTMLLDESKRNLIGKDVIFVKKLTKYLFILDGVLVTVYNFTPLAFMGYEYFANNKLVFIVPYDVIVPFRIDMWPTWAIIYTHSVTCGFICGIFLSTADAVYCVLTSHICNNFIIISNEIKNLKAGNTQKLKDIAKSHQYILFLSEYLEDIFNLPNLFNVLVASLEICALGFTITMGEWTLVPGCLLFLSSVLLQILMMSVFGENLITESKNVGEAAFNCDWYNMDEVSKKIILSIMIRSHRETKLTAYKFSIISYGSFTKIIRNSWTYFTLLKTVYKGDES